MIAQRTLLLPLLISLSLTRVLGLEPGDLERLVPGLRRSVSVQGNYVEIRSSRPTITGSLPAGWEEDSSWADVTVTYRPQTINPHSGDRSLRAEVSNVRNGSVQFRVPNVVVTPTHLIRMKIPLRSEDNRGVNLVLRKRGNPYTTYWSTTLSPRPEWGVFEVLAISRETDTTAVLTFAMNAPGTVEVGDIEMEYLTPEQALAGRDFTGNLLQTSSFPLGLSAPWACGANGTTSAHLAPDASVPGPSGLPSLRLVPHRYEGRPMMQITSPFIGRPGATHTFSFWARADRPGMNVALRMGPPSEQLWTGGWNRNFPLTTEWTRYEHTVTLPPAPDMLYLARITSHDTGTFWVDQVMVEVGDKAGEFKPTGPIELHAVADREFGLSFEDEPMTYRVAITGALSRAAKVKGSVLDLYGRETELPTLSVPAGARAPVVLETRLPAVDALGSFLVTHQVVDADGKPLGRPAELLLHRVRKPRHWGEFAFDSPFGTHVVATPTALRMAKALGFNWNRAHYGFNWSSLQRADGSWDFASADASIAHHAATDMLVLTHFGGVPARFSVVNSNWDGANSWWRTTAAPRMDAMDAYEEYCYQLLSHAGKSLQAVETWNEPFLPGFFVGDVQNGRAIRERPEVLVEMKRRSRRAAERAGYTGKLLWNMGPHYGASEKTFDTAVRDLGGAELVDGLTFHRYTNANLGFPDDRFAQDMAVIREVFAGKEALRHVWNSEGGHGLSELFNLYRQVPPNVRGRADAQAAQYVRFFLSNFAAGAEKMFIYTFFQQDGWVSSYGYLNVDGTLSQIAPATSNMAWILEGKTFSEMRAVSDAVYAQHYRGKQENTVVFLPTGRTPAVLSHLPRGATLTDIYGNTPALPVNFTSTLLYLSAPGLTLDQAAQILTATDAASLPVLVAEPPAAPAEPQTVGTAAANEQLRFLAVLVIAMLVAFWIVRVATARR